MNKISLYVDSLILEAYLSDEKNLIKTAQGSILSSMYETVKDYVNQHIDPNDKLGSFLNMLAPAAVSTLFGLFSFKKIGLLVGLLMSIFHIDIREYINPIINGIKSIIGSKKEISSPEIKQLIDNTIEPQNTPATEEDAMAYQAKQQKTAKQIRRMLLLKQSCEDYDYLLKTGGVLTPVVNFLTKQKGNLFGLLKKVLFFAFGFLASAAGFMVAGDVINKFIGRPNAIDKTYQQGPVTPSSSPLSFLTPSKNKEEYVPQTKQTMFKVKSGADRKYNISSLWEVSKSNNESSIEDMVVEFANEVYEGLVDKTDIIKSTEGFKAVVHMISTFNERLFGTNKIYIPEAFKSKKIIVDMFIDDVAEEVSKKTVKPA